MTSSRPLIRWGTHYQLGHEAIDRQHEDLIEILNTLYADWNEGAPRAVLAARVGALVSAVLSHFQTEEQLMTGLNYAGRESHKQEHDSFAAEVSSFQNAFRAGDAHLEDEVFEHLATWLRNHLIVIDKPMAAALRGRF
jgi:hemerythrin-like metal-binding protein